MDAFEDFPRISPFLTFDGNAEEAVEFYLTVFKNSRKLSEMRPQNDPNFPDGKVLVINFELDGTKFVALNGGPSFKFSDAVSFVIRCETQAEIDEYWDKFADGGQPVACGWIRDRFGLAWQVVPAKMGELVKHPAAMQAMMQMVKLDIAALERAAQG